MEIKKRVFADQNSWLVKYILRYFKSIELSPNVTLWDELVEYFKPSNNECEYMFDSKGKHGLYPVLSYDPVTHKVTLVNFEWICEAIEKIKTGDFLTHQVSKTVAVKPAPPIVEDQKPVKKKGFWSRLLAFLASLINRLSVFLARLINCFRRNKNKDSTSAYTQSSFENQASSEISNNVVDIHEMSRRDYEESSKLLEEANGISIHEAHEMLLKASYRRKANRSRFITRLENDKIMGSQVLKTKFNLAFLFDCGILNSSATQEFKKTIPASKEIDLKFEVTPTKVEIDPELEKQQLINI